MTRKLIAFALSFTLTLCGIATAQNQQSWGSMALMRGSGVQSGEWNAYRYSDLLSWYEFDNATNLTLDSSLNGRNGVVSNGFLVAVTGGANFTNKPYMACPKEGTKFNEFTFAVKCKATSLSVGGDYLYSIYQRSTAPFYEIFLAVKTTVAEFQIYTNSTLQVNFNNPVRSTNGIATYICSVQNNNTMLFSLTNGSPSFVYQVDTNCDMSSLTNIVAFRIGEFPVIGSPFDGIIYEVRTYGVALSSQECVTVLNEMGTTTNRHE